MQLKIISIIKTRGADRFASTALYCAKMSAGISIMGWYQEIA